MDRGRKIVTWFLEIKGGTHPEGLHAGLLRIPIQSQGMLEIAEILPH